MKFESDDEFLKFMEYAKVANPGFNPAEAFIFLHKKIFLLSTRIMNLQTRLDQLMDNDEESTLG